MTTNRLTVLYNEKPALSDIELGVPRNEITAVFGPANSGTTTFLRSLNRLCEVGELIKEFTIVIAPHNVQQAGRIADRAAFLLNGKAVEHGSAAQVFTNHSDKRTSDYIEGRFG